MAEDSLYYVWLQQILWSNSEKLQEITNKYGDVKNFYEFSQKRGLDRSIFTDKQIENSKIATEKAFAVIDSCKKRNIEMLSFGSENYPDRLKNIYNPPLVIYYKGKFPDIDNIASVAVVGTRLATKDGKTFAYELSYKLTRCGITIVSGGARGIDSEALQAALKAGGNPICVTATGQDEYYPKENKDLFEKISQQGLILSEYPPGVKAMPRNFPIRNRIISALSLGVAVIEAPIKSGAIITANLALDQGKDVFSTPGSVQSYNSKGSNQLLKLGAIPLTSYEDIVQIYLHRFDTLVYSKDIDIAPIRATNKGQVTIETKGNKRKVRNIDSSVNQNMAAKKVKEVENLSNQAKSLYEVLSNEAVHIEELIIKANIPASVAMIALSELQIYGLIKEYPGRRYSL